MLFRSDRKSTRLNSSHLVISYAVFCLKKKRSARPGDPSDDRARYHLGRGSEGGHAPELGVGGEARESAAMVRGARGRGVDLFLDDTGPPGTHGLSPPAPLRD